MPAMRQSLSSPYLFGGNAPFVEELYESYLYDPQSVPEGSRLSEKEVVALGKVLD
jgi:2-oxoglutarate dehydrogenase E1 component